MLLKKVFNKFLVKSYVKNKIGETNKFCNIIFNIKSNILR